MIAFLQDAIRQAFDRQWWLPGLVLAILLTVTNIVILSSDAPSGATPGPDFIVAAILRLAGLLVLLVLLMRLASGSPRHPLMPDGGFWLFVLLTAVGFGLHAGVRMLIPGDDRDVLSIILASASSAVLSAPFAPWMIAAAVERPLALNPVPWFRRFGQWLPPLILWQLILVTPLAVLHAYIDIGLLEGRIARSIALEIFDGVLSTVIALLGLALAITAYRRVAKN